MPVLDDYMPTIDPVVVGIGEPTQGDRVSAPLG